MYHFRPFETRIAPTGQKVLIFDPKLYAFAAYNPDGKIARWGPAVGGKPGLETPEGTYEVYAKGDAKCRSTQYPEGCSGMACSAMPYCMTFHQGYALHAGHLPGRHASHGCVRLFYDDAKWLNEEFVEIGTKVIIKAY